LNRYAEVANANVRVGRAKIAFSTINDLIFGFEMIITVYLAAKLVLANQLTVGMIFAFMAYKQHFIDKSVAVVEKGLDAARGWSTICTGVPKHSGLFSSPWSPKLVSPFLRISTGTLSTGAI
jgi:ABC-type multidrug transport system fused ATPase/permease subunit